MVSVENLGSFGNILSAVNTVNLGLFLLTRSFVHLDLVLSALNEGHPDSLSSSRHPACTDSSCLVLGISRLDDLLFVLKSAHADSSLSLQSFA